MTWGLQGSRSGRNLRTERGSVTRSGDGSMEAYGLSDDVTDGDVLRLTEPRSNRNAIAAISPALADVVGLRWVATASFKQL